MMAIGLMAAILLCHADLLAASDRETHTIIANEGDDIELECGKKGEPWKLAWKRTLDGGMENETLCFMEDCLPYNNQTDKFSITQPDYTLNIKGISVQESGTYFCTRLLGTDAIKVIIRPRLRERKSAQFGHRPYNPIHFVFYDDHNMAGYPWSGMITGGECVKLPTYMNNRVASAEILYGECVRLFKNSPTCDSSNSQYLELKKYVMRTDMTFFDGSGLFVGSCDENLIGEANELHQTKALPNNKAPVDPITGNQLESPETTGSQGQGAGGRARSLLGTNPDWIPSLQLLNEIQREKEEAKKPDQPKKCPPETIVNPCVCVEEESLVICENIDSVLLPQLFMLMSLSLGPGPHEFDKFVIRSVPNVKEIPANTFANVTFKEIHLDNLENLSYIHPDAFGPLNSNYTELLNITRTALKNNKVQTQGESTGSWDWVVFSGQKTSDDETKCQDRVTRESDLFKAISKLSKLRKLHLYKNQVAFIPNNAFNGDQPKLKEVWLGGNRIACIGKDPFIKLPSLNTLVIHSNNLSSEDSYLDSRAFCLYKDESEQQEASEASNSTEYFALILSNNGLKNDHLKGEMFSPDCIPLNRPVNLHLDINLFDYMDEQVFSPFFESNPKNQIVDFSENQFNCYDCRNAWFIEAFEKYEPRFLFSLMFGLQPKCGDTGNEIWQVDKLLFAKHCAREAAAASSAAASTAGTGAGPVYRSSASSTHAAHTSQHARGRTREQQLDAYDSSQRPVKQHASRAHAQELTPRQYSPSSSGSLGHHQTSATYGQGSRNYGTSGQVAPQYESQAEIICGATRAYKSALGMDQWCELNCAQGYCPSSHCQCVQRQQTYTYSG